MCSQHRNPLLFLAVLCVALAQIGTALPLASIPKLARDLEMGLEAADLTIPVFVLGSALAAPWAGSMAHRRGRRFTLILSLLLVIACSIGLSLVHRCGAFTFLSLRLLQGFGTGGTAVVGRIVVRDHWSGDELTRALSLLSLAFVGAMGGAQFVGGMVSWRVAFALTATMGVGIGFLATRQQLEVHRQVVVSAGTLSAYWNMIRSHRFIAAATVGGLGYGATLVLQTWSVHQWQGEFEVNERVFGFLGLFSGAAYALGAMLVNRCVGSLGTANMLRMGIATLFLSSVALAALYSGAGRGAGPAGFLILHMAAVLGQAVVFPTSSSIALGDARAHGSHSTALLSLLQQALGGCVAGLASTLGVAHAGNAVATAGMFAMVLSMPIMRTRSSAPPVSTPQK